MNVLFVCTGNICRSPMAAAIARDEVTRAGYGGIEISSAGIAAIRGASATRDAEIVAAENGLSLAGHRARQLTADLVATADLVVAMRDEHAEYSRRVGGADVVTLGSPIHDPYGLGVHAYRETWTLLGSLIPALLRQRLVQP